MNRVEALGQEIASRRRELGLTQQALADMAKLHRNAVGLAERGKTSVAVDVLFALADCLQVAASDLLLGAERNASTRSRPSLKAADSPTKPERQVRVRTPRSSP